MSDVQAKKKKQMLSSYSIVFLVLIVVAILTWFVPQSVVIKNNGTKEIIYNAIMVEGKVVTGQGLQPMACGTSSWRRSGALSRPLLLALPSLWLEASCTS